MKAHRGYEGNERADEMTKLTLQDKHGYCIFKNWQEKWTSSKKRAITREFFPTIKDRMGSPIVISYTLVQILTATTHKGIFPSRYLHCFKIPQCFDYRKYEPARSKLIRRILTNGGYWKLEKKELISDQFAQYFIKFIQHLKIRSFNNICSIMIESFLFYFFL